MRTARKLKQRMKYGLISEKLPVYVYDDDGNIIMDIIDGKSVPRQTGETRKGCTTPVEFTASITNRLSEALMREYGVDESTNKAQITTLKGELPLKVGSLIWKQSDVEYEDEDETIVIMESCDYKVVGVADEGLLYDLFLLERNVK